MLRIHKNQKAEDDLIDIWVGTLERWGEAQADRYLDDLDAAIDRLSHHPDLGKSMASIREGYRALSVNRHIVYYLHTPSLIRVVRVLHDRMDPDRHL